MSYELEYGSVGVSTPYSLILLFPTLRQSFTEVKFVQYYPY